MERIARDKHSSLLRKSVNYGREKFYRIGPRCQFHKHFTNVTYSRSKISWLILKTLHGSVHAMSDGTAYFARSVIYGCQAGKSYRRGRLSTVDHLVLTILDQLLFILKTR